jgi:hypothetical protein
MAWVMATLAVIGQVVRQQTACRLRGGEDGSERLVELMREPGGKLAQRVQAANLPQAQQLLRPVPVMPLAQKRARCQQQHGHQQRPAQHPGPRKLHPAHLALGHQLKRLAVGAQCPVELKMPAARALTDCVAGLQHQALPQMFQRHPDRAGVQNHGPFVPRNHGTQVNQQRIAGGLGAQDELVAAFGKVHIGQRWALLATRFGLCRAQAFVGPRGHAVAPLHRQNLRIDRGQALLGARGIVRRAQQGQRGQHGVVLRCLLAEQPVGNACICLKRVAQSGELHAGNQQRTDQRRDAPCQYPGRVAFEP